MTSTHASDIDRQLSPDRPWPGLEAFRESDRGFFQGREQEAEELHRLVQRSRLTVLLGVSGLGKTSLLQAGLFPRLRDRFFPVLVRLDHKTSAKDARRQIVSAILAQAEEHRVQVPPIVHGTTLWEYFHHRDAQFWDPWSRLLTPVLVFDQFEEIFTQDRPDGSSRLLEELADLVEGRMPTVVRERIDAGAEAAQSFIYDHNYRVVLSLREDFLANLDGQRHWMPSVALNRVRLLHWNGEEARAAIERAGGALVAGVADAIVRIVAGPQIQRVAPHLPGHEPLPPLSALLIDPAILSLFCRELNEFRIDRHEEKITPEALELARASVLRDFYERNIATVDPGFRVWLEEKLITRDGLFRDNQDYANTVHDLGPQTGPQIKRLVDARVLRIDERAGRRRIELTHDVLVGIVRASRNHRRELARWQETELARAQVDQRERATGFRLRQYAARIALALLATLVVFRSSCTKSRQSVAEQSWVALVTEQQGERLAQTLRLTEQRRQAAESMVKLLELQNAPSDLPFDEHIHFTIERSNGACDDGRCVRFRARPSMETIPVRKDLLAIVYKAFDPKVFLQTVAPAPSFELHYAGARCPQSLIAILQYADAKHDPLVVRIDPCAEPVR